MNKKFWQKFLPAPRKKGDATPAPESVLDELYQALERIEVERRGADSIIHSHDLERRHLLASDADDDEIKKHDLKADRARIVLEKLALAEQEIQSRIKLEVEEADDNEFREWLIDWRESALAFFEATEKAREEQARFLRVNAAPPGDNFSRIRWHDVISVVPPAGALSAHVAHVIATENARLAANEQRREAQRAAMSSEGAE